MKNVLILLIVMAMAGSAFADYAVYSLPGWGTYINDTGAIAGDRQLTASVADHIVSGQFDADPFYEVAYSVAGSGVWIQNCSLGDPDGTSGWKVANDDATSGLAAADLDGDGLDEVVFTIPSGTWTGTYANNRTFAGNTKIHASPATFMATGQFDSDTSDEIALAFAGSGAWVHDGLGIGANTQVQPSDVTSLTVGNVDGDALSEVIYSLDLTPDTWDGVYVDHAAIGDAGVHNRFQSWIGGAMATGDFEADGMDDVVFTLTGHGTYVNYEATTGSDVWVQNSDVDLVATGNFDADPEMEILFNIPGWGVYVNQAAWASDVKIQNLDAAALAVVPIPEPATLVLLGLGGLVMLRRR